LEDRNGFNNQKNKKRIKKEMRKQCFLFFETVSRYKSTSVSVSVQLEFAGKQQKGVNLLREEKDRRNFPAN
jgi:hypothetical protein